MTPVHFSFTTAFILGLMGLAFHRTHLLSAFAMSEGMMLSLFIGLALWTLQFESTTFSTDPMLSCAFLCCEASTGLALLVATTLTHGTDRYKTLNLLQS
uniref:NADH-ubiquinone oxidoreductase chain 4L n=1 Tax=Cyprinella lepida TaxID=87718 RepID=O99954_9TELE|nr:NADH dehydrogenase subunit 4L [Cyprinella lepida]